MNLEVIRQEPSAAAHPTPILFVHGMWHAAWCWEEHFMPYFAQHGYACYALSLRGHGASEGRSRLRWTSLADYVADVAQVASQMDRPPVLVGHSMGGMTVQKYLESHPAPAAVLLAAAPARGVLPATLKVLFRHPIVFLRVNLTMSMAPVVATPDLAREALFSTEMPTDELNKHFARLQNDSYRAYLDMLLLNLPRPKRVSTPVLVLGAANDSLFSPAEVEATARAYGTQAEIFPDMAHDMMLERGWQAVADRILAWLDAQDL